MGIQLLIGLPAIVENAAFQGTALLSETIVGLERHRGVETLAVHGQESMEIVVLANAANHGVAGASP
jgi:hypothetical protein